MSLRMALEEIGLGPCYHMETVLEDMTGRVPHWNAALDGQPDWDATYAGFASAVDWPTAAFHTELLDAFPEAKIILSTRSPESWYASISQTILAVLAAPEKWPPDQKDWLDMVSRVVIDRSLGGRTDPEAAIATFKAHEAAVRAAVPADRLLVFEARDGWEPLCAFLGKEVPDTPYPRSNSREEFFALLAGEG
ncbi:hypothetical protein DDZ14_07410 [Maritimibacter sp. 55A14]|nr:hypothetical protein DDZ14_07410 [Maritimibacter sp. 55A14]